MKDNIKWKGIHIAANRFQGETLQMLIVIPSAQLAQNPITCIPFSVSSKICPIELVDILLFRNCNKRNSRLDLA
jgi:hypothetical protein